MIANAEEQEPEEEEGEDVCWCGVKNPYYQEMHGTCGGSGYFDCHCGGDLCVCHNHGEVECFGCSDCEHLGTDGDDDDYCPDDGGEA